MESKFEAIFVLKNRATGTDLDIISAQTILVSDIHLIQTFWQKQRPGRDGGRRNEEEIEELLVTHEYCL